jgi:hypothetical protein
MALPSRDMKLPPGDMELPLGDMEPPARELALPTPDLRFPALAMKLQPFDLLEKLAIWPEGGADVGFDQQGGVHDTVFVQVQQLISADRARRSRVRRSS